MNQIEILKNEIAELEKILSKKKEKLISFIVSEESKNNNKQSLSSNEITRYSRQMLIPEIGVKGQINLKEKSFLIVGLGGLGCPAIEYLVRAGCIKFGLIDYDTIDINNLNRQILYTENSMGKPKAECSKEKISDINSICEIEIFSVQLNSINALPIISKFDIILDCTDNVPTRYLLNDACVLTNKPLISGSALKLEGQLTVYNYKNGPCYRCIFPKPPRPETVTNCSDGGILGAITGTIGCLQALEAIKIALNFENTLHGRLLLFDGSTTIFRNIKLRNKNIDCCICSKNPVIKELIDYEEFCGSKATDKDSNLKLLQVNERLSVEHFKKLIDENEKNILLIDVRKPIEFELCQLKNFRNIPLNDLIDNKHLDEIRKIIIEESKTTVLCLCRRGNDSQLAVEHLKKNLPEECEVKDIVGGLHAWQKKIDKNFPVY